MVGLQITLACAAIVLAIVLVVFLFVVTEVKPAELFEPVPDAGNVDLSAVTILRTAVILGAALIVLAGLLSWSVARRAVRPLGEALRIQRSFVADASHELRTPLAVLDARLQVLQRGLADDDPSTPIVEELREDAKSLITVVNDLLVSAEAAGSGQDGDRVATEVAPVVEVAVSSMRVLAAERSISITLNEKDPAATMMAAASLNRCVIALLDNALRHSPDDSTIVVEIAANKKIVTITVADHGVGIQGIEPSRIFDRFARGDTDGGERGSGSGIGLALVRDTVVRAGGSVSVAATSAAGTAIAFALPAAPVG